MLCSLDHPIKSLALHQDKALLWVGSTCAHFAAFDLRGAEQEAAARYSSAGGGSASATPAAGNLGSSPASKNSPILARLLAQQQQQDDSAMHIGSPPERRYSVAQRAAGREAEAVRPLVARPCVMVPGRPSIVQARILEDRQHVLCKARRRFST